jgi:AraC-like DNA-binding protein
MDNYYQQYIARMKTGYYAPAPKLRNYIKHYFYYEIKAEFDRTLWNPITNGFYELFIHMDNSSLTIIQDDQSVCMKCFLKGLYTLGHQSFIIPNPNKNKIFKGVCVTFYYPGLFKFLENYFHLYLINGFINLDSLLSNELAKLYERLNYASLFEILEALDFFFLSLCTKKDYPSISRVGNLIFFSQENSFPLDVSRLAEETNISYRTLHRLFQNYMGLPPKEYLKIVRFNKVCDYLRSHACCNWQDIVIQFGYYDQAHFIREFKKIMKLTPKNFLQKTKGNFYLNSAYSFD